MSRAKEMRDLPSAIDATSSGNVGIGGTANEYSNYTTLTINHDTSGGILDIERNGNLVGELYTLSATDFGIQTGQATGAMRFSTNAGEVLTLLHSGEVGVGNNAPASKLHVSGTQGMPSSNLAGMLLLRADGSTHGMTMGVNSAAPWGSFIQAQDQTSNTTNYPLSLQPAGGIVGIGTDAPGTTDSGYNSGTLHVHSPAGSGSQIRLTNTSTGTGTSSGFMISKWSDQHTYITNFDDGKDIRFTISNSSGALDSNAFTIKADATYGKIGIGTDSPEVVLEVNGDQAFDASDNTVVFGGRSGGGNGNNRRFNLVAYSSGGTYGGGLKIQTRDSSNVFNDRMTIDHDGDIGIGTTPYTGARLTLGGTDSGGYPAVLQYDNNNSSGAEFFMLATDTNWSFGGNKFIMGHGNPSSSNVDFSIDSAGIVGVGPYAPNDSGGFGSALDIVGVNGGALYLTDHTDSKQATVGMWNSNLSIHSRPADGEISFYISNDKQFKVMANGSFQAEDQNNRSAAIVSPTNVVHTGAYPYHPTGDGIGNNQTNSLQLVFAHIYARVWSSGRYIHIKTDIPVTGSNYGMVVVYAKGYRYSPAGSIDSSWGFHNWGTAIYSLDQRNYATTFAVNCYVSSDNYVVLVGDNQTTGTSYTGFQLSFLYSNTNYPAHTQTIGGFSHKVLAASLSTGTSGVY